MKIYLRFFNVNFIINFSGIFSINLHGICKYKRLLSTTIVSKIILNPTFIIH